MKEETGEPLEGVGQVTPSGWWGIIGLDHLHLQSEWFAVITTSSRLNQKKEKGSKVESGKWSQENNNNQKDFHLDCKEIKPVHPKGNQPWMLIGRTDAKAEAPIRWPPDVNSWLFAKDPDDRQDWRQKEKRVTEDEMVGWHHNSMNMYLDKLQEMVRDREAWRAAVYGITKSWTLLGNWITTTYNNTKRKM